MVLDSDKRMQDRRLRVARAGAVAAVALRAWRPAATGAPVPLKRIDCLSTVSGGGYLGGADVAFSRRKYPGATEPGAFPCAIRMPRSGRAEPMLLTCWQAGWSVVARPSRGSSRRTSPRVVLAEQGRRSARSVFALDESLSPCPLSHPPSTAVPVVPAPRGVCWRGREGAAARPWMRCSLGMGRGCGAGRGAACRRGRAGRSTPATWSRTRCITRSRGSAASSRNNPGRCGSTCAAPSRTGSGTSCGR